MYTGNCQIYQSFLLAEAPFVGCNISWITSFYFHLKGKITESKSFSFLTVDIFSHAWSILSFHAMKQFPSLSFLLGMRGTNGYLLDIASSFAAAAV